MLKDRDFQPGPCQMNRAHQARRAATDDNDTPVTRHDTMANRHPRVLPILRSFTAASFTIHPACTALKTAPSPAAARVDEGEHRLNPDERRRT